MIRKTKHHDFNNLSPFCCICYKYKAVKQIKYLNDKKMGGQICNKCAKKIYELEAKELTK